MKLIHQNIAAYLQLVKFAIAGAIGAIIEISTYIYLVDIVGLHYLSANGIAIGLAILVNYIISQKWVFQSGRYSKKLEFSIFIIVSVFALLLNQLLMWSMVENTNLDDKICKVLAIGIVAFFNFFAKKFFVFKR